MPVCMHVETGGSLPCQRSVKVHVLSVQPLTQWKPITKGNLNITFLLAPILHGYLKYPGNMTCFYDGSKRKAGLCKDELLLREAQPKRQLGHRGCSSHTGDHTGEAGRFKAQRLAGDPDGSHPCLKHSAVTKFPDGPRSGPSHSGPWKLSHKT